MATPAPEVPSGVAVTYSAEYRRCGKAGCARCAPGQRGHGPYWYARWTSDGHRQKRYVGRTLPPGVESAGSALPASAPHSIPPTGLWIQTLGGFAVWRDGQLLPDQAWGRRKSGLLLACLLSAPEVSLRSEQILDLLWPDPVLPRDPQQSLRASLHALRALLTQPRTAGTCPVCIEHARGVVSLVVRAGTDPTAPPLERDALDPDTWFDAAAFAALAGRALATHDLDLCQRALDLYRGPFLPTITDLEPVVQRREVLAAQHVAVQLEQARLLTAHGATQEAEALFRAVLQAHPTSEAAAAPLMGLLHSLGRPVEALQLYAALDTALQTSLAARPSPDLRALRTRITRDLARPHPRVETPRRGHPLPAVPAAQTSFVGREDEQRTVLRLLGSARLVTLIGAAGCGKTRLALAVAERVSPAYAEGVCWVELAAHSTTTRVAEVVAAALGVQEEPQRSLRETLVASLAPRHLLLVLDNCEHVRDACADVVGVLLERCPSVRVLATSREALAVQGEEVYGVPPLPVPNPTQLPPPRQIGQVPAVRLFLDRAREQGRALRLTSATAPLIVRICVHLDGLPLALELAAACLSHLSLDTLAARLDARFRILTGGPRSALPRYQTLQATLDWSYELLTPGERLLLRRLGIFRGGWTSSAAHAICVTELHEVPEVPHLLARLLDTSLIMVQQRPTGARYQMLETIRLYALERLRASGEEEMLRRRHALYYVDLTEEAASEMQGSNQAEWLERLEDELPNVRAALQWARGDCEMVAARGAGRGERTTQRDRQALGLRLATALHHVWWIRGRYREGVDWIRAFLDESDGTAPPMDGTAIDAARRATALRVGGVLLRHLGDFDQAATLTERSLALSRTLHDPSSVAAALDYLGDIRIEQGDYAAARTLLQESLAVREQIGDQRGIARVLNFLGSLDFGRADYASASARYDRCLAMRRAVGDAHAVATALNNLGVVAACQGDADRAQAYYDESLAMMRRIGNTPGIALVLKNLGDLAADQGDDQAAEHLYEHTLSLLREVGAQRDIAECLAARGWVAHRRGQHRRALSWYQDSLTLAEAIGWPLGRADALAGRAAVAAARRKRTEARDLYMTALRLYGALDQRRGIAACLEGLGRVLRAPEDAVRVLAAATALRAEIGAPRLRRDPEAPDADVARLRAGLGAKRFADAWHLGRTTSWHETIAAVCGMER